MSYCTFTTDCNATLGRDVTVPVDIGALKAGTKLAHDIEIDEIVRMICGVVYLPPTVEIPSPSLMTIYAKGDSGASLGGLEVKITKGDYDIKSVKLYKNNILIEEKTEGVVDGGAIRFDVYETVMEDTEYKAVVYDGKMSVVALLTYSFVDPIYTGTLNGTLVRQVLLPGTDFNFTISCTNDIVVVKIPIEYGEPKDIRTDYGTPVIGNFIRTVEAINGVRYYVYTYKEEQSLADVVYTVSF